MKKSFYTFMLVFTQLYLISYSVQSQISNKARPKYLDGTEKTIKTRFFKKKGFDFDTIPLSKIHKEDSLDNSNGVPPRFGYPFDVNITMQNSGEWFTLENGDKIWRLEIKAKGSKSINFLYDKFWIPDGATFHIYNNKKSQYIGGFTSINNKGTKLNPGKFGTGLVFGNHVVLEYFQPSNIKEEGLISISKVIYGYRYINIPNEIAFGDGPTCSINVNCSEGASWQAEKTGVALILVDGNRYCSGSLIKNVKDDGTPYFLTANHCLSGWANPTPLDAISNPDASDWSFYWNYESSNCTNGTDFTPPSTSGATVVANSTDIDFALLRLTESPYDLSTPVQAYFNGWDRQNHTGSGVGIHHPAGDIKKISTFTTLGSGNNNGFCPIPLNTIIGNGSLWVPTWSATTNGNSILAGGSSGSPLFNSNKRIIGQAFVSCAGCTTSNAGYGKLSRSWNSGTEARRRLRDWLDPDNTNVLFINGGLCNRYISNTNYTTNQNIDACEVIFQNVQIINGAKVIVDTRQGTTINGNFEVQLGSELEIK